MLLSPECALLLHQIQQSRVDFIEQRHFHVIVSFILLISAFR